MKKGLLTALSMVLFLALVTAAMAEPKRYTFSGEIAAVSDPNGLLAAAGIGVGSTFSGQFTYDPANTSPILVGTPGSGVGEFADYMGPSSDYNIAITVDGTYSFYGAAAVAQVVNDDYLSGIKDRFSIGAHSSFGNIVDFPITAGDPRFFNVQFIDTSMTIFSDTSLPVTLSLADFDVSRLFIGGGTSPNFSIAGVIDNLTLSVSVPATVDIHPDTLNLQSKGSWTTAYIELPDGFAVSDIVLDTVALMVGGVSTPAALSTAELGDYDNDGVEDLMVKFDRESVQNASPTGAVEMLVSGTLTDGADFEGGDIVLVIDKGKAHTSADQSSVVY